MLETVIRNLTVFPLTERQPLADQREAAVLLALTDEAEPQIVLTRRAVHLNDHPGEVALPGGMWESSDTSLLDTVLRESQEEINLSPAEVDLIATLPTRATRLGIRVTPFVGLIPSGLPLQPELSELDAVFNVPLSHLLDTGNLGQQMFSLLGGEHLMPCYRFEDYPIWGFTLSVLADFLNQSLDAGIELVYPSAIRNPPKPHLEK